MSVDTTLANQALEYISKELGYNIVKFSYEGEDDVYILFTQFDSSDESSDKHFVKGQNITDLLSTNVLFSNLGTPEANQQAINTQLDKIDMARREFSKHYRWTTWVTR